MNIDRELCTDLESSVLLHETKLLLNIEPEYYYNTDPEGERYLAILPQNDNCPGAYRFDQILTEFPEWFFSDTFEMINDTFAYHTWSIPKEISSCVAIEIYDFKKDLVKLRGQELANRTAKFLYLLWKEGFVGKDD